MTTTTVHIAINPEVISVLSGSVIPLLVALVTKWQAPAALKAVINALLSAITGALATAFGADGFVWQSFVLNIFLSWATSIASCCLYRETQRTNRPAQCAL